MTITEKKSLEWVDDDIARLQGTEQGQIEVLMGARDEWHFVIPKEERDTPLIVEERW